MLKPALLIAASLAFTSSAIATPCSSLVKKYTDTGLSVRDYKDSEKGFVLGIENGSSSVTITPSLRAVDVALDGDDLYVLSKSGIEHWSLSTQTLEKSWSLPINNRPYDQAYAVTKLDKYLFIAHGRSGMLVFDTAIGAVVYKSTLVSDNGLLESSARGITKVGNRIIVAMDNYSITKPTAKPAFAGLIVFNTETFRVESQLKGFDPGVTSLATDGTSLFASFGGTPIWQYSVEEVLNAQVNLPEPTIRIWSYPEQGHPAGHASFDGKRIYTCFAYRDPEYTLYQRKYSEFTYSELGFL